MPVIFGSFFCFPSLVKFFEERANFKVTSFTLAGILSDESVKPQILHYRVQVELEGEPLSASMI